MADDEVLTPEETEAMREVLREFKASVDSGGWEVAIKNEAKRRVHERRQANLRDEYADEVGKLDSVEARLRLRDKYRKLGLKI